MFDAALRRRLERPLIRVARVLDRPWVTPDRLTVLGLGFGLASAIGAGFQAWTVALTLWLLSRLADGLDGTLARLRTEDADAHNADGATVRGSEAGGFLDITADFVAYGATTLGIGFGVAAGFGSPFWPFAVVLLAYYVNGGAFLAFSSIAERTGRRIDDGRSLSFLGRMAEGTETIVVHGVWLIFPGAAWVIALVWAAFVAVSAVQRIVVGYRLLR